MPHSCILIFSSMYCDIQNFSTVLYVLFHTALLMQDICTKVSVTFTWHILHKWNSLFSQIHLTVSLRLPAFKCCQKMIKCWWLGSDCIGDNVAIMLASVHAQAGLYFLKLGDIIKLLPYSSHIETIDGRSLYFLYRNVLYKCSCRLVCSW